MLKRNQSLFPIQSGTLFAGCGGTLRVKACIEESPLIHKILEHVQRREALISRLTRAPPDSHAILHLT